ncbi:hypothetical protein BV25DRAFT_1052001 [Artomyces pyxidatus]|uniref:Uncharacterized protein n=1 Tax=Artomyces pyxidatus TaxID=48021 RepID=A0ACB8STR3_9AGAM|nr:hypothetical protein BV25DRAFT_1052001 [Artomyces pyxidatus]
MRSPGFSWAHLDRLGVGSPGGIWARVLASFRVCRTGYLKFVLGARGCPSREETVPAYPKLTYLATVSVVRCSVGSSRRIRPLLRAHQLIVSWQRVFTECVVPTGHSHRSPDLDTFMGWVRILQYVCPGIVQLQCMEVGLIAVLWCPSASSSFAFDSDDICARTTVPAHTCTSLHRAHERA